MLAANLVLIFLAAVPFPMGEIEFLTSELPWAVAERGYEAPPLEVRVSGKCPIGGVGYAVAAGSLPPGIELSQLGYFSGAALHTGDFTFSVRALDGCGSVTKQFTLVVTGAPILRVRPVHLSFECKAGENPAEQLVHVSGTWPKLGYRLSIAEGAAWLTAIPEHGSTPRPGSAMEADPVHVRIDSTGLKPGKYNTSVTISSWQAPHAIHVEVELIVR